MAAFGPRRESHDFGLHAGFLGYVKEYFLYLFLPRRVPPEGVSFTAKNGVKLGGDLFGHQSGQGYFQSIG
jgi:hypothetical protein